MQSRRISIRPDLSLHVLDWPGAGRPFVLLHGLSSNARTWEQVAARLAEAGHRVLAIDQRGHGLSDKPEHGYDFALVAEDLRLLIEAEGLEAPIIAGQSWGGNVVLAFAASYPGVTHGLAFIDGGFLHLRAQPGATWGSVSQRLRPPDLTGTPRDTLHGWIRRSHPEWDDWGVEATLANMERLPDGTVRPWLSLDRHLEILRAMFDQDTPALYPLVREPVVIAVAGGGDPDWEHQRMALVHAAEKGLARSQTHLFAQTDHDIHIHRPDELAALFLHSLREGLWA